MKKIVITVVIVFVSVFFSKEAMADDINEIMSEANQIINLLDEVSNKINKEAEELFVLLVESKKIGAGGRVERLRKVAENIIIPLLENPSLDDSLRYEFNSSLNLLEFMENNEKEELILKEKILRLLNKEKRMVSLLIQKASSYEMLAVMLSQLKEDDYDFGGDISQNIKNSLKDLKQMREMAEKIKAIRSKT